MKHKGFKDRLKSLLKPLNGYCCECITLFGICLIIRIAEAFILTITYYHSSIFINCLLGFMTDIAYIGWIVAALYLIYYLISRISVTTADITIRAIFATYIFTNIVLTIYFAVTHIPLDSIITAYSPKEIFVTLRADSWYNIPILALIFIMLIIYIIIRQKHYEVPVWTKITLAVIAIASIAFPGLDRQKFKYDREYYIVENKVCYMLNSLMSDSTNIQFTSNELQEKSNDFAAYFPDYEFVDYHYPFMHKDKTPDILSDYLEKREKKPDIVIIIVEGLGNYISGNNSTIASATPFLDSLAEHSLVWENCLSTSERTFGALPSILGALPFGEKGFMSYRHDMPNFRTLATILNNNGYKNTFFYGGWYGFDDMDVFAKYNSMEMFYNAPEYESVVQRNEWGLLDEYMLSHSLNDVKKNDKSPRLDIYLTLTTHNPFSYPNSNEYISKYKALPQKEEPTTPVKENASFMYADDCLKNFLKEYEQCEQFDRTIFIITGDHKFNTKDRSNILDNYHVPLIIWSPMLRESHRFPALVTHRDIAPSLLSYFKHNYSITCPENEAWLNHGLDTCSTFRSKTFATHYYDSRKLNGITYGNYFITTDKTYKFDNTNNKLSLIPTDNNENANLIELYQALERYIMNNDALVPNEK
ncbi:MAG: LTA synthase family protein [Bacteroidales bacterium]|nr:LTA synthase family protein [Bacteroidales bacterium]